MKIFILLMTFVIFLMLGTPVFFAMGFSSVIYFIIERGIFDIPSYMMVQKTAYNLNNFTLLSIPLFIFVAKIMNESGLTERLFGFARAAVGHWKGGLGQVNILASVIFSGMSGSATADAAGLGSIEIKAMRDAGFPNDFTCGITAASSLIGPIIPPSIPAVMYAILSGVSVSKLLVAGIIPGLLLAGTLGIVVYFQALKANYPTDPKASFKELIEKAARAFLPMMTPVILVGGILSGVFTATEAAAVAVFYAIVLACIIYRTISLPHLYKIAKSTMIDSSVLMIILGISNLYSWILTRAQVPMAFTNFVSSLSSNYYVVMGLIMLFLLFLGLFFSSTVSIAIATPIFMPLLAEIGADPLHFGIIMILTLMVGNLTPPFGMVLFATCRVGNIELHDLVRAVSPYLIPIVILIIILVLFPSLVTFIPNTFL